jgi:hypothetical protein
VDNVCALFLGRDWSRIAIYSDGFLVLSRDIKAGVRSMVEAVQAAMSENLGTAGDGTFDKSFAQMFSDLPVPESETPLPASFRRLITEQRDEAIGRVLERMSDDRIFEMILPAVDRVNRQVEMTAQHYFLNFGNERVERLYVSGVLSTYTPMQGYMGSQLGLPVSLLDPLDTDAEVAEDVSIPAAPAVRSEFVPAVGMALSKLDRTPNFLLTYKEKEEARRSRNLGRLVWAVFFVLLAAGVAFFFRQERLLEEEQVRLLSMRNRLDDYSPIVSQEIIAQAVSQIRRREQRRNDYGQRYRALAVVSEISRITPDNVRLATLTADLGPGPAQAGPQLPPQLLLDGIVFGERLELDAALADYIIQLQKSELFRKATLEEKKFGFFEGKEVLQFTARMDIK